MQIFSICTYISHKIKHQRKGDLSYELLRAWYGVETDSVLYSRKYKFDYLEPDAFSRLEETEDLSVIGSICLRPTDRDSAGDKVIISNGLNDYYFRLKSLKNGKRINPRKLIGYVMTGSSAYAAVYKKRKILPAILILGFVCFLSFILL